MKNERNIQLIGETVDDAIGEAFDKVAKLIGLKYPGGFEIEKKARRGDENSYDLPKPLIAVSYTHLTLPTMIRV